MADPGTKNDPRPKSKWEKLDIILRPAGGMLTALSVALVGFYGTRALESGRVAESNARLYAELMSSREASDSALRQGMFNTIVSQFLSPGADLHSATDDSVAAMVAHFEMNVLQLEILAYNFHDSLDLAPLFKDVHHKLSENERLEMEDRSALLERLERVASEVIDKQISALDEVTNVARERVDLNHFEQADGFVEKLINRKLSYRNGSEMKYQVFLVDVISIDRDNKEVQVRLAVWNASASGLEVETDPIVDVAFKVGLFDFPLVDNTRIGSGERCSLVLNGFSEYEAQLSLVYFPGSRASLKEKQFYDDIVRELQRSSGLKSAR